MLLAAVHGLLGKHSDDPLAAFYASLTPDPEPPAGARLSAFATPL